MKSRSAGLLCILLFLAVYDSFAQTPARKPDKIHRLDRTVVEGFIDEVNKSEVQYKKVNDPKGPLYAIQRKEIWKIVWNNGDEELINPPMQQPATMQKPTDLLVTKKTVAASGWDSHGLFVGAQIGAGVSLAVSSAGLESGTNPGFAGGITVGYHKKGLGLRLQANYTRVQYGVAVPDQVRDEVSSITGTQSQLLVPLTVIGAKKLGNIRITGTLGGFGVLQLGSGSLKVAENGSPSSNVKNCESCYSKDLGLGLTGGIGIRFLEKPTHALFVEANWYHHLGDNKNYAAGENNVNVHLGLLSAGVLFHFPR